jgi:hypothetical protein
MSEPKLLSQKGLDNIWESLYDRVRGFSGAVIVLQQIKMLYSHIAAQEELIKAAKKYIYARDRLTLAMADRGLVDFDYDSVVLCSLAAECDEAEKQYQALRGED